MSMQGLAFMAITVMLKGSVKNLGDGRPGHQERAKSQINHTNKSDGVPAASLRFYTLSTFIEHNSGTAKPLYVVLCT